MCGIVAIAGADWFRFPLAAMVEIQRHRGPDASGIYGDPAGLAALGHNRLSIIDLSEAGRQPMTDASKRYWLVFNGELYNYLELRAELSSTYDFRTCSDTEVFLAAYGAWGEACLDRMIGMFAFAIWDERDKTLFAARDRFGVKPLYYHQTNTGALLLASEIRTIQAAGVGASPDETAWSTYLARGLSDRDHRTFWNGIEPLPPGHKMVWRGGELRVSEWYNLADHIASGWDDRPVDVVKEEYRSLLIESVRLRFRSDVPVGINLSGGLDSSALLSLVHAIDRDRSDVKAFTFITGDPAYDELPWVNRMLASTNHPLVVCELGAQDVPKLAESVNRHQSEPFGGIPTLAYARLFERARGEGVIVLL